MLCQWYAMFAYWQFIAFALSRSLHGTADPASLGFRDAALTVGRIGAFYNAVAFLAALAMVLVTRRYGARMVHAVCLAASGAAMLASPGTGSEAWLYVSMIGIGLGWAGLGWAGLGWAGLGWAGLGWAGLGWAGLGKHDGQPLCHAHHCRPAGEIRRLYGYFQYVHRRANDDREPDGAIGLP